MPIHCAIRGPIAAMFVQIMLCGAENSSTVAWQCYTVAVHMKHYGSWVDEASLEAAVERYNEGLVAVQQSSS